MWDTEQAWVSVMYKWEVVGKIGYTRKVLVNGVVSYVYVRRYINDCRNLLTGERRRLGVRRPGFFTAQVFMSHKFN